MILLQRNPLNLITAGRSVMMDHGISCDTQYQRISNFVIVYLKAYTCDMHIVQGLATASRILVQMIWDTDVDMSWLLSNKAIPSPTPPI